MNTCNYCGEQLMFSDEISCGHCYRCQMAHDAFRDDNDLDSMDVFERIAEREKDDICNFDEPFESEDF
jgi:hypothetical protein